MEKKTFAFEAEVEQVLDIVVHALYTDKEIFLRELISNASDAMEKLRHLELKGETLFDEGLESVIRISSDETAGTITIQDAGVGMNAQQLQENLGRIAHSGSKAFLKALKEQGKSNEALIGQFGVGFYSAFMVASEVQVFTHSWKADEPGLCWTSSGQGGYRIEDVPGQRRGAKIIVRLKDEYKDFAKPDFLKACILKYSSFVSFPILLNDEKLNTQRALWTEQPQGISKEDYESFYRFQAKAMDTPLTWLHFSAEAPLDIRALLFVPEHNEERFGLGHTELGVALHCRKVLIDPKPKHLLPGWLRFLRGVVDSADLPLNISRESMQDSALMQKISKVLTKKFIKHLEQLSEKEPEAYKTFYERFGGFIKEGITRDPAHQEALGRLLRFSSAHNEAPISLKAYVDAMPAYQKNIYYLYGRTRQELEHSPYLEAFKARKMDVLFLDEPVDEFALSYLRQFDGKTLISAGQDKLELEGEAQGASGEALEAATSEALCSWMHSTLNEQVESVQQTERLSKSPVMLLNTDPLLSSNMRRVMKAMQRETGPEPKPILGINPRHPLIHKLEATRHSNPDLATLALQQLLDGARLSAGLLEDPTSLLQRNEELLESALS